MCSRVPNLTVEKVPGAYPSTSPSLIPVKTRRFAVRSMSRVTPGNAAVICCTKFFCEYGFMPHSSQ